MVMHPEQLLYLLLHVEGLSVGPFLQVLVVFNIIGLLAGKFLALLGLLLL